MCVCESEGEKDTRFPAAPFQSEKVREREFVCVREIVNTNKIRGERG